MEKIKVILIDPVLRSIEYVEIDPTVEALQQLIECDHFELAGSLVSGDDIYVDYEGLYKNKHNSFISIENGRLLSGRVVITGNDEQGNTISTRTSLDYIQRNTRLLRGAPLYQKPQ